MIAWASYALFEIKNGKEEDKLKQIRATCGKWYELVKLNFEKLLKTVTNEYFNGSDFIYTLQNFLNWKLF